MAAAPDASRGYAVPKRGPKSDLSIFQHRIFLELSDAAASSAPIERAGLVLPRMPRLQDELAQFLVFGHVLQSLLDVLGVDGDLLLFRIRSVETQLFQNSFHDRI